LPSINPLHEEFKGQRLTVLLVNMREDREIVRRAVTTRRYTAPVILDTDGAVANAYRVTGTPTVYLLIGGCTSSDERSGARTGRARKGVASSPQSFHPRRAGRWLRHAAGGRSRDGDRR